MHGKSAAIVDFIANLLPLYDGGRHGDLWCARSMQDGTLVLPVDESEWDEEQGTVLVRWQGMQPVSSMPKDPSLPPSPLCVT
jgi:hypothetical protein